MSAPLSVLEREGALSALDVELSGALCRMAGETRSDVALAVALASREVQSGHVCADLARLAGTPACSLEAEPLADPVRFPALEPWLGALATSPLVSTHGLSDPVRPLVLDSHGRLYLARYFDHEQRVAAHLTRLASDADLPTRDASELADRLFPPRRDGKVDLQREAALSARTRRLSVIVGGPGTGKTSTVVKLLALLVHDARERGESPPRTVLVAPTGKAAQRLTESIESARDRLPIDDVLKRSIETRASTLHRALGPLEGSLTRFRHGPAYPLECDVVLLDEASMVDLALMRRFLDAVPAHARVILLGDADQLASVEAGSVLHDVCRAAESAGPLHGAVSRLLESYRYPADSGIAALARAVHAQSLSELKRVLRAGLPDVSAHAPVRPLELSRALEREVREHYLGLKKGDLDTRLGALDHFRVLCAHRRGPGGVEQLNPAIGRALGQRGSFHKSYPGRPIIVTQNDYATQLFNGDVGVIHAEGTGKKRELLACFRAAEGPPRKLSVGRLPTHESAYAMTVHKSQGSEFDHVAIVLPERPSPILSRELLYTAITRAKRSVSLHASDEALSAALHTRVTRSSGLIEALSPR